MVNTRRNNNLLFVYVIVTFLLVCQVIQPQTIAKSDQYQYTMQDIAYDRTSTIPHKQARKYLTGGTINGHIE